jgi:signal transduction histidine kinase
MRRVNLLRSTAFRLVIAVTSLFLIAFFLASIMTYRVMSTELETWQHRRIEEVFALISDTAKGGDKSEVIEAVAQHADASGRLRQIFLLQDVTGKAVAGNIPAQFVPPAGWSTSSGAKFGFDADIPYLLYRGNVGDFSLTVGLSGEQISEIKEIVLDSFGWASFMVISLAIIGGGIIATRTQKRLDTVRETMNEIASGRLGARIPATKSDDDIALLSRDINIALARLSALVEGMKQVSTDIAHDLKTPLNRLKILINSAADRHSLGANVQDELEAAEAESDRINATFDALLRIAQLETGARRARFSPVAASDILGNVCEVYEDVAEDSAMRLTADIPSGPAPVIQGDRELLTQLFANLIENALRHCPSGTEIHCSSSQTPLHNVITIADNGQGIPASERENVLRRLYRLEKSRTTDGTGLGLSMVKAIADLHGAQLRLDDNKPGLRVEIAFPITAT